MSSSVAVAQTPAQNDDAHVAQAYEAWIKTHEKPLSPAEQKQQREQAARQKAHDEQVAREQHEMAEADAHVADVYSSWPIVRRRPTNPKASPYEDNLLGDWWGIQPFLSKRGIELHASYLGMEVGNVAGGMRRGADYAGQVAIGLDVDWGKLAGLTGFSTHMFVLNRTGRPVGRDYVGDSVFNENEIYGAGGNVLAHLGFAYAEQKLFKDHVSLMAGRMGAAMLFNSSPIYCDFFSFAGCPTPRSITGGSQNGFVMPPQNNWAFYSSFYLEHNVYMRTGINAVGGPLGGRSGFNWSSHGVTGVMFPFEMGWTPTWGPDHKPVHLHAGFYGSTAQGSDVALNTAGKPLVLAGGAAKQRRGYFAAWAGGDIMLLRQTPDPDGGLVMFFNYTHTDNKISIYQDMGLIGMEDRGFWKARPLDRLGLMFVYSQQSNWLGKHLRNAGSNQVPTHTSIIEGQYGAHILPGTVLTGDLQYIMRPGATGTYRNAIVLGTSLQVAF